MTRPREPRLPRKVTAASINAVALAYLQRFATSAQNLRNVLMRRVRDSAHAHDDDPDIGAKWVDSLIERFLRAGLLDDASYAAARAATMHRRGASARGIRAWLAAKGVAADDIDHGLDQLNTAVRNTGLRGAYNYARRRRLGPWRARDRDGRRDRDLAALARQGHGYDVARVVIDARDIAELEAMIDEPCEDALYE
jgi:regulatory protein